MVESINIVLFWTIFLLILLTTVIYFLVICTVRELVSPLIIFSNFFRIWRLSIPFLKKVLILIPKIFFAWTTFLAVIYLLLFLVIKFHFFYFDTWEVLLPKFIGGTTVNSKIIYNVLTFNKFLQHISFLKVYFFFFYDSLYILISALWGIIKSTSTYFTKALILNILCLPFLLVKFIICDAYNTLSETFLLVTAILFTLGKLFLIFLSWLYRDSEDWIILAVLDFMLVTACFLWFCYFIYLLHDRDYYKDKNSAIIILAVLRNIFYFFSFLSLVIVCKNICMHVDKFLLINYDYQWKLTSVSIYDSIIQFLITYYNYGVNYVEFANSLNVESFADLVNGLIRANIHRYILTGSSILVILISWSIHIYSTFMGLCVSESLDVQCTETKRLLKLEEQNSSKVNPSLYVLVFGFILIISLNAFGPDIFSRIVLNSILFPIAVVIIDVGCTILMGLMLFFLLMQAWLPNFFYFLYFFFCLSIILHFITELYIKYNIVARWQVAQNFGVRDNEISEYDQLSIVDLVLLFCYTILVFFKYIEHKPDTTFYNFIITKIF